MGSLVRKRYINQPVSRHLRLGNAGSNVMLIISDMFVVPMIKTSLLPCDPFLSEVDSRLYSQLRTSLWHPLQLGPPSVPSCMTSLEVARLIDNQGQKLTRA